MNKKNIYVLAAAILIVSALVLLYMKQQNKISVSASIR